MTLKLISSALVLFAAFMSIKHGWQGLTMKPGATGPEAELFGKLNLSPTTLKVISLLTLLSGILILMPQTFVAGNILNAALIFFLMVMFFYVREFKTALIEIPFLLIPLALIYLKYPLG
ncbi:hypothetical protein ACFGVS_10325 [Mucilaginibacter sp. AW1-7]|uniref:hypothetical protein n=1 Tax=Mucilaginibacter sp. AW1-7 TaxID=3349874 RepID=UPI003F73B9DD